MCGNGNFYLQAVKSLYNAEQDAVEDVHVEYAAFAASFFALAVLLKGDAIFLSGRGYMKELFCAILSK